MRWLFTLIFHCTLAACINHLQAQSYSAVHYDTKDGLPSATVYDMTQDKNGFVWFATENGMCRFDGKNFKTFTTKDGLPDNSILKVHGDNTGRVYFTPFTHGLYYYQNDSFHSIPTPAEYIKDVSTITLFANKGNSIILSGISDSYVLENDSLISFHKKFKTVPEKFYVIKSSDSVIIAGSFDSLYFIPDKGKIRSSSYRFIRYNNYFITYDDYARPHQMQIGKWLLKTTGGGYLSNGLMYRITSDMVLIFSISTGDLLYEVKAERISSAFFDNENSLWITTLNDGVYRYPSFAFTNMNFGGKNEIFSLARTDQVLLAGADLSMLYNLPLKNPEGNYSSVDFSNYINASGNPVSQFTRRNRIYTLRAEGKEVYIGTDAFLLKRTGNKPPVFVKIHPVKDIDIEGQNLLVCTGYNVQLLDKETMSPKDTLLRQRATCGTIYQGACYAGTLGGLIRIDPVTKKITELSDSFPAFKRRITALEKGINNDLWVATSGSGLIRFQNGKIIQELTEKDGLTSDICTSIFVDSNLLWLGTNNGLNRIDISKDKPTITRFTSANGLGADFINTVVATDSNVYVGSAAGIAIFSKNILAEKSICVLHVLQVSENNQRLKNDSNYSFPYNAMNIRIDYTAISFKSAGDITYYYKLEGLDESWNTTTSNFINFSTLHPETYTLHLKAVNKFGVESNTKTIRFRILPPWWQTWLFRVAALAALVLIIFTIYWYNIRSIKKREQTKRKIESRFAAMEQKALQAQMNPHFIFNSLNSIQTFILNLDVEGANTYLSNFASLIRQTLDNSMHPLITIASEVRYLETYLKLEKLRFREKFSYEIHVDEAIDQANTVLPGMLLQPYIENSLRHGIQHRKDNNGLILLTVSKSGDNSILYTITDNGVGRKKAEELKSVRHIEYQSRGTSINRKRIAAINNQLETNIQENTQDVLDANGMVAGTTVTVLIPWLHK